VASELASTQTAGIAARSSGRLELERALTDAHERTWSVLANLTPEQWHVPYHPGINPPLWEFGHVAWFNEWWVLRDAYWNAREENVTRRPSMLSGADRWFDSGRIAHVDRWTLDIPPLAELRDYANAVLDGVRARVAASDEHELYASRLTLFHEDMHGEALAYMRQTLGYPPPFAIRVPPLSDEHADVDIPGGVFMQGAPDDGAFVFDNEKWARGNARAGADVAHLREQRPFRRVRRRRRLRRSRLVVGRWVRVARGGGIRPSSLLAQRC